MSELPGLTVHQAELVRSALPGVRWVTDHSWGLVETAVLELTHSEGRFIVKAGGASDHHIAREIRAHERWLTPWTSTGHAPVLFFADVDAKVLITHHLPGRLVEGDPAKDDHETFRQAGHLLAALHHQYSEPDPDSGARGVQRALSWLDRPHHLAAGTESRLRAEIASWPTDAPAVLVPGHGDWQPRNWLIEEGRVSVIDFGRTDLRPAVEDFARLARQDFARDPELETAFFDGYGCDPREGELWRRTRVLEAIGTAVWAFGVGDEGFEQLGLRQIARLLAEGPTG